MEFWGVEVKGGEPLKVKPDPDSVIHLSQAALGESKKEKGNEPVPLFVKIGDQKLVLGTLSSNNFPHISFDLVFEKEFELSHNWKNGTVSFTGYQSALPDEEGFSDLGSSEDEEEELPLVNAENGRVEVKTEKAKPATPKANVGKPADPKAKLVQPSKANESDEDDESDDDDESEDDEESAEGMSVDEDSDEDDDDESDSEDEETPKKAEQGKKRTNDSATKTPVSSKKAKLATPQKTDGKKAGQVTPHPAKKVGKTTANGKQTPKSGGQFSCNSCERSFGTDAALQSHSKAKHSGK